MEAWLRETDQGDIDFEVDDALDKLRRLGIITGTEPTKAQRVAESLANAPRERNGKRVTKSDESAVSAGIAAVSGV